MGKGGGVLPYSLGGGTCAAGFAKVQPFTRSNFANFVTLYQTKLNCSCYQSFVSDPVKRDSILDQFFIITRPYTRLNGLKTIPFPAAHTRIARNIWEYPPSNKCTSIDTKIMFKNRLKDI